MKQGHRSPATRKMEALIISDETIGVDNWPLKKLKKYSKKGRTVILKDENSKEIHNLHKAKINLNA